MVKCQIINFKQYGAVVRKLWIIILVEDTDVERKEIINKENHDRKSLN